jgi:antitoxin VapB
MPSERAKLFAHGGSQAVRLPKAFRFGGTEVFIRREGDRVILEPVGHDPEAFWAKIDGLADQGSAEPLPLVHLGAGRQPPVQGLDAPR